MTQEQSELTSPFHPGELEAQTRMGVREKIKRVSGRRIREYMPDQHREFYATLPFILLGTVDDQSQPWASIVVGKPGFISSPDPGTLNIAATPLPGDPLHRTLVPDAEIGLLGIQMETRRRNRLTGRLRTARPDDISIEVRQAFGNCPQYIQTRTVEMLDARDTTPAEHPVIVSSRFDTYVRSLLERSDTLFIATAYSDGSSEVSRGADVSHRGGKPGFVRIEDDQTFVFPDFSGNLHFNTVGNILLNPRAGFLFVDFKTGDLVYMTGEAEIVWANDQIANFAGAERLVRFHATQVIRIERSLPLHFEFGEFSPLLEQTGDWS